MLPGLRETSWHVGIERPGMVTLRLMRCLNLFPFLQHRHVALRRFPPERAFLAGRVTTSGVVVRELAAALYGERGRIYPRLALVLYALGFAALLWLSPGLVAPNGKPLGSDFITFWSAGHLTLMGDPKAAFDVKAIVAAQRLAVPGSDTVFLWHYPPTFQVVAAAIASLPYLLSYLVFIGLSLAAYAAVLRQLIGTRDAAVLLLAYPATMVAALHGQNSLLSAALIGGALLMLDKRPAVAGVCIGLLAYKPQLAVLFPLVLVIAGRWRVFAWAAATAVFFAVVSTLLLGTDLWRVFLANAAVVREAMGPGQLPWDKMPSAFIQLRMLGLSEAIAYGVQIVVAVIAAGTVGYVWHRTGPTRLAGATLVTGTLLMLPYTFDYEMALLAIPLAVLAVDLANRGGVLWQKMALLGLYVLPPVVSPIAKITAVQIGFFAIVALFIWVTRRALSEVRGEENGPFAWLPGRMFSTVN